MLRKIYKSSFTMTIKKLKQNDGKDRRLQTPKDLKMHNCQTNKNLPQLFCPVLYRIYKTYLPARSILIMKRKHIFTQRVQNMSQKMKMLMLDQIFLVLYRSDLRLKILFSIDTRLNLKVSFLKVKRRRKKYQYFNFGRPKRQNNASQLHSMTEF